MTADKSGANAAAIKCYNAEHKSMIELHRVGSGLVLTDGLWEVAVMGSEDEGTAMIAVTCRRCGSTAWRRNGRTLAGPQQVHCQGGKLDGTLETKAMERAQHRDRIAPLHLERRSQRASARTARAARATGAKILPKSPASLS
jgi:hypothetical protein